MTDPHSLYCSIMAWLATGKPAGTYFTAGEERVVATIVEDVTARLRAENARLRAALEPFAAFARATEDQGYEDADWIVPARTGPVPTLGDCRRARAALEGQGDG